MKRVGILLGVVVAAMFVVYMAYAMDCNRDTYNQAKATPSAEYN